MTDGFRVDGDALAAQAARADGLADRMRRAADAGRPLDVGAYGVVGQMFAVAVAGATGDSSVAVAGLAELTAGLGDELRATHADYRRVEDRNRATFGGPP